MPNETKHTPKRIAMMEECLSKASDQVAELLAENETLRQQNAELVRALQAIEARIHGDYDDPLLLAYGPLGTLSGDCSHIVRAILAKAQS